MSVTGNPVPARTAPVGTPSSTAEAGTSSTCHSTIPTYAEAGFVSVARSAVVVTGSCVTTSYAPVVVVKPDGCGTSTHCSPSRYCSVHDAGTSMPPPSSKNSTRDVSTVTGSAHVSCAHWVSPVRPYVPHAVLCEATGTVSAPSFRPVARFQDVEALTDGVALGATLTDWPGSRSGTCVLASSATLPARSVARYVTVPPDVSVTAPEYVRHAPSPTRYSIEARPEPPSVAVSVRRRACASNAAATTGATVSTFTTSDCTAETSPSSSVARARSVVLPSAETVTGPVYAAHSPAVCSSIAGASSSSSVAVTVTWTGPSNQPDAGAAGLVENVTTGAWSAVARTVTVATGRLSVPATVPSTSNVPTPAQSAGSTASHVTGSDAWPPSLKTATTRAGSTGAVPRYVATATGSNVLICTAVTSRTHTVARASSDVPSTKPSTVNEPSAAYCAGSTVCHETGACAREPLAYTSSTCAGRSGAVPGVVRTATSSTSAGDSASACHSMMPG